MQRPRNLGRTDASDQRHGRIASPYQHLVTGVIGAELFPQRKRSRARSTCDRSSGSGGSRCRCRGVTGVPDQGRLNRSGLPGRDQTDGLDLLHEQRRCCNKDRAVVMQCQDTVTGRRTRSDLCWFASTSRPGTNSRIATLSPPTLPTVPTGQELSPLF